VHKKFLVATIVTSKSLEPHYQKKRFSTFNGQILALKAWLLENNCRDVCMESTGKYWVPVFNLLEDSINVTIANPKWVRAVKGNKDDTKDSKWIADLFRMGVVRGSFIPLQKNSAENLLGDGNNGLRQVSLRLLDEATEKIRLHANLPGMSEQERRDVTRVLQHITGAVDQAISRIADNGLDVTRMTAENMEITDALFPDGDRVTA
jgi:transposase